MKTKRCYNCAFYSAYYKQWFDGFHKQSHGFCSKINEPQKQHQSCQYFKDNERREKTQEERLLSHLELSLQSVNQIAQILKEKFDR